VPLDLFKACKYPSDRPANLPDGSGASAPKSGMDGSRCLKEVAQLPHGGGLGGSSSDPSSVNAEMSEVRKAMLLNVEAIDVKQVRGVLMAVAEEHIIRYLSRLWTGDFYLRP
jgi:hypothetical protein